MRHFRFNPDSLETPTGSKSRQPPTRLSSTAYSPTRRFAFSQRSSGQGRRSYQLEPWREWCAKYFAHVCTAPFGARHVRLWDWFDALERGVKPAPRIEIWPRGSAKSSTGELGTTYVGLKGERKFALYVCATQDQADKHVASIAALLERAGVDRKLNKFGSPTGWRRNQLQAANGFSVEAFGLDTAVRGIKIEQYRPDVIVFDDVDELSDSPKMVAKKEEAIQKNVIPAGSPDVAIVFLQNLVNKYGVVARLADKRAEYLLNREVPTIEKAVEGMVLEQYQGPVKMMYRIVGGTATWEGQDLQVCERQINEWGLKTFRQEAQHEIDEVTGLYFDEEMFEHCWYDELPEPLTTCVRGWDTAITETGDWNVGVLGYIWGRTIYIEDVVRFKGDTPETKQRIIDCHLSDPPGTPIGIEAAIGAHSIMQDLALDDRMKDAAIWPAPMKGKTKLARAQGWRSKFMIGELKIKRAPWNEELVREWIAFTNDPDVDVDDQIDGPTVMFDTLFKFFGSVEPEDDLPMMGTRGLYNAISKTNRESEEDDYGY